MPATSLALPSESFTATAIAELICEADGLPAEARLSVERKLRRLATGRQLHDGEQVTGRETWVYPAREIYRARLFLEFARLGIDVGPAERALSLATFSLGGAGLDAILEAARASDGPMVLEVLTLPIEGNIGTTARVGAPSPLLPGERSRVTINVGQLVRDIDCVLAEGH